MLFFLAGLAGIPEEYHEAAKIDGAGAATRFYRITLPLLGPTIGFVAVIALVNALVQIDHVIIMTGGGPTPSTIGAVQFMGDLVHKHHVMPEGVIDANAAANAFFSGRTAMLVHSTGALGFSRNNMKLPFKVAFVPRAQRLAVPIGGASLLIPTGNTAEREQAAWKLVHFLTSPAINGGWSRFTGYFAPVTAAYDLPEMKSYLDQNPDAKVAIDQLAYAQPWFATFNTVGVRKFVLGEEPGAWVLEPAAFQILVTMPDIGIVSHTVYVEQFPGPFPFLSDPDYPGR